ncbi:uncharacterized protein LOC120623698 [Pararge aegeria]|uniref:uncharacterized protein LOC120623698 n=1 Tax=Pararge aegeria TaxID=116150 RepID=UPI0019CFE904|nr:uncharacterized protein LOC120623698 [Pararge aegeria]
MEKFNNLKQLLQRKQELIRIKAEIERSESVKNHKEYSYSQNSSADIIDQSDTECIKLDVQSFLAKKSHNSRDSIESNLNSSATDIIVDINESDISTFQSYDTVEIKKQKEAVVNYSSSDSSNILNTSTLCLEMSHSFFNDSNNSDLVKSNNIPESSETEKKINIVSVENVDNILTAKLNEKKYCELYSNDSVKRCNKNDVLPLKETKKYSQNVNQIVTFNECSNIPNTSFCKLGLDISKSACAPVMAFDLPTSQSTDIAPLDTVSPTSYTDIKALALPVSSCTAIEIETLCTDHATPRGDNKALGLHSSPSLLDFVPTTSCADIMYMDIPKAHSPDISVLDIVPATSCTDGMNVDSPVSLAADIPVQVIVPETACDEISDSSSLKKLGTLNLPTPSSSNTNKNRMPDIKKSRKRKCIQELPKLKKEHIDFISDDECYDKLNVAQGEDFSSGSSDLWSGKESDNMSSSNSENDPKHTKPTNKRKKLQKKRNIDKPLEGTVQFKKRKVENKRKIRRMKREKGDSYETSSGKLVEKKTLKANPCEPTKCPRNCFEITEERRQSIFDYFWNLNSQRKKDWLVQCALRVPVNRPKKGVIDSKRKFTYEYYINEGEGRRQELNTSKIRIATMKKKDVNTFTTKHSMKPDATTHEIKLFDNYFKPKGKGVIKGKGKGKGKGKLKEKDTAPSASNETLEIKLKKEFQQLKPLYKKRLAISEIKYKDLTKLCNDGVIPSRYHGDFTNLPYAKKIQDTLNQTDEDDSSVDSV